jgi:hypothetical protein
MKVQLAQKMLQRTEEVVLQGVLSCILCTMYIEMFVPYLFVVGEDIELLSDSCILFILYFEIHGIYFEFLVIYFEYIFCVFM